MTEHARRIYTGQVVTLDLVEVRLPNGHEATFERVGHPGGAAVVALNAAGEVCLLRQFRHAAGGWLWEVPAGKLDGGQPLATAMRELAEEAGLTAERWDSLGAYVSSPGVFTEVVHLFLARELTACPASPEADEVFTVAWVPFAQAVARALDGDIVDGKTIIALARAQARCSALMT